MKRNLCPEFGTSRNPGFRQFDRRAPICYHHCTMKELCILLFAVTLVFLPGCTKDEEPRPKEAAPAAEAQPAAGETEEPASGPQTIQLEPRERAETDKKPEVQEVRREAGTEAFLAIRGGPWIVPEDFSIGPLQSRFTSDEDTAQLLALVLDFFGNLSRGVVDEDLLQKDHRRGIQESLAYYIERELLPESLRIGLISTVGSTAARCNVRLYRGGGVSAGEVYFEKTVDRWYISDIQVDFSLLGETYVPSGEPYEPGVYKYLETF